MAPPPRDESTIVARIAQIVHSRTQVWPDFSDDCAALPAEPHTRLISADALIEGVHFDLARDHWRQVGAQAAVANLSDLAASGGRPRWLVWSLIVRADTTLADLEALTHGLLDVLCPHGVRLVGGNLSVSAGPIVVSVTVGGDLWGEAPLSRSGAQVGDVLYLAGAVGDAALGWRFPDAEARAQRHTWAPQVAQARRLAEWGQVSAMMDVSDGLLKDADRLARASGVGLRLRSAPVPRSAAYRARHGDDPLPALSGGEDYVLLFTAPAHATPPLPAWAIGQCVAPLGLWLDGEPCAPLGYDHFSGA